MTQVGTPENTLNGPRYDIFSLLDFIEQPAGEIERPSDAPAEDLLSWGTSHLRGRAVKPRREERELSPDGDSDPDQDSMKLLLEESPEKKQGCRP